MQHDAVIVGSGPNGLAAAVTLAQAGLRVVVLEAADTIGGGTRTQELTEPGFRHDVCAAFHPLGVASPFFRSLPLERHGLRWLVPEVQVAHPLDDGTAAAAYHSVNETAAGLGEDGDAWIRSIGRRAERWDRYAPAILGPLLRVPSDPVAVGGFGLPGTLPATTYLGGRFRAAPARALFAGMAAHSFLPLTRPLTASFGLLLSALCHVGGWPVAEGGSRAITDALAALLRELGGEITTGHRVTDRSDLPTARVTIFTTAPGAVADVYGHALPRRRLKRLRGFRHGPGAFKVDLALDGPVPWTAPECRRAGTIHVGGTWEEVAEAERAPWHGAVSERPFVLVGQQSVVDPSRAPEGKHTLWAYCHVPSGSDAEMTEPILDQIERFAPGFRTRIMSIHSTSPADFESYNSAYVGGDIGGGAHDGLQLVLRGGVDPYRTGVPGVYLGSASTPPGAGVHGMGGYNAAQTALGDLR